jgi:malate/lactate dehydrogenase
MKVGVVGVGRVGAAYAQFSLAVADDAARQTGFGSF